MEGGVPMFAARSCRFRIDPGLPPADVAYSRRRAWGRQVDPVGSEGMWLRPCCPCAHGQPAGGRSPPGVLAAVWASTVGHAVSGPRESSDPFSHDGSTAHAVLKTDWNVTQCTCSVDKD